MKQLARTLEQMASQRKWASKTDEQKQAAIAKRKAQKAASSKRII